MLASRSTADAARPRDPRTALEVRVEWGVGDALRVDHFAKPRAFHVGDSRASRDRVDFDAEEATLGLARFTLVEPRRDEPGLVVFVPEGADVALDVDGVVFDTLASRAAARLTASARAGIAWQLTLAPGERATVVVGGLRFLVALVEPSHVKRPTYAGRAFLLATAVCAFAFVATAVHTEYLGHATRFVDTRIDVSHPVMARLIARRAERARHAPAAPTLPNTTPVPSTPRTATSTSTPTQDPASTPATPTELLPQGALSSVHHDPPPARATSNVAVVSASISAPVTTAPNDGRSAAVVASPPTPQAPTARPRDPRVATMFAMRAASRGLADCYARYPTNAPDAATQASHLARCIADVRQSARDIQEGRVRTNDTPGRDAALIEWDIEVDTHEGETVAYEGGRAFVATQP